MPGDGAVAKLDMLGAGAHSIKMCMQLDFRVGTNTQGKMGRD